MTSRSQGDWVVKFLAAALLTFVLAASVVACRPEEQRRGGGGGGSASGNVNNGRTLFTSKGCPTCHQLSSVQGAAGTIGPTLNGLAQTAATRKPGMSATDYVEESIKDPAAFVVQGYPAPAQGGMILPVPISDAERKDLVAFLMTQ
jgi:cytochrome c551/c552